MKTVIIYASVHHGNTKKLVDAITAKYPEVDTIDSTQTDTADLSGYDVIGFASGIYGGRFHPSILKFAEKNYPGNKMIFLMSTSAMNKDFEKSILGALKEKQYTLLGNCHCFGYNTFGPFKLVGGTSKGHPDDTEISAAVEFFGNLPIE